MITTVEGVYKQGKIELLEMPKWIQEARVLVTFLTQTLNVSSHRRMSYGQFAGPSMSTEDDFRLAEWHGEIEKQNGDEKHS